MSRKGQVLPIQFISLFFFLVKHEVTYTPQKQTLFQLLGFRDRYTFHQHRHFCAFGQENDWVGGRRCILWTNEVELSEHTQDGFDSFS